MRLEDLFPPCTNERCGESGSSHKHVFPHQIEFIKAPEKYMALIGGYGAGKSLPAAILGHLLSVSVPGNRGFVGRRSYPKLHDSVQRVFMEVIGRSGEDVVYREQRDGWPHRVIYANGSEIFFRETKDIGRFLGPEYGWFLIDEAIEEPEATFTLLMGRLRLPAARRHLKGFITSNPPDKLHWIPKFFGLDPGIKSVEWKTGGKTTSRLIRVATSANLALPPSYEGDLRAHLSPGEARRVLDGEYGFPYDGKPVYSPPFEFGKHVGEWPVRRNSEGIILTITRGWDFGFHCPAVTWQQIARCFEGTVHWHILEEFVPQNMEWDALARYVMPTTKAKFENAVIQDIGDAAGAQVSDKGPGPIMRLAAAPWNLRIMHRKFPNIEPGIALIREALSARNCRCGRPVMMIERRCSGVINTLAGGYHYPIPKSGKETHHKPVKDGYYDNIADSLRYVGELSYRLKKIDPRLIEELTRHTNPKDHWKIYQADPRTAPLPGLKDPWG